MTVKIARRLLRIVITFVCWAVGCSGAAFVNASVNRNHLCKARCARSMAHMSGCGGIPPSFRQQKATAIRDDVESRLWPLFEKFFGRVPLSDGDERSIPSATEAMAATTLCWSAWDQATRQSPLVTKRVTTAPPARFSMVNLR